MSDALQSWLPFVARIIEVALGIGFVIFVHELGHFLVAKWAGIRVETFSLGFGPRLLGFRRGDTDYRLSLVPLGGYVKMAGENPDDPRSGSPDEFAAKSPGARAAVVSAGVIMNTIFAVVLFLVAFKIGVQMHVPVVGRVLPETPAAAAGLLRGDEVVAVDGEPVLDFVDVGLAAALADERGLELRVRRRGALLPPIKIAPRRQVDMEYQRLGIEPIDEVHEVEQGSAAEKAGLRPGDRILALVGEGGEPRPLESHAAFERAVYESAGAPVHFEVWRQGEIVPLSLVPEKKPARTFGIELAPLPVIRGLSPKLPAASSGLAVGDVVVAINGEEPGDTESLRNKIKDAPKGRPIRLEVERDGARLAFEVKPVFDAARNRQLVGIELGSGIVKSVAPGSPAAAAGIEPGAQIVAVDGASGGLAPDTLDRLASVKGEAPTRFEIETRSGARRTVEFAGAVVEGRFFGANPGYRIGPAEFTHRAPGLSAPIRLGFERTWMFMEQVWLTVKGMFEKRIDASTLGGPIAIGKGAYDVAGRGVGTLLYFLAVISVNLAVLNILPVPILDGGHLVFIAIEKLKGSPVSPNVQAAAQWVGLVLLLALMVFVTWNDIVRLRG